jgi:hypothetical protein
MQRLLQRPGLTHCFLRLISSLKSILVCDLSSQYMMPDVLWHVIVLLYEIDILNTSMVYSLC